MFGSTSNNLISGSYSTPKPIIIVTVTTSFLMTLTIAAIARAKVVELQNTVLSLQGQPSETNVQFEKASYNTLNIDTPRKLELDSYAAYCAQSVVDSFNPAHKYSQYGRYSLNQLVDKICDPGCGSGPYAFPEFKEPAKNYAMNRTELYFFAIRCASNSLCKIRYGSQANDQYEAECYKAALKCTKHQSHYLDHTASNPLNLKGEPPSDYLNYIAQQQLPEPPSDSSAKWEHEPLGLGIFVDGL